MDGGILITGGAGFIGCNLAARLAGLGKRVSVYDNFSRAGVEENARWLRERHGKYVTIAEGDVRDERAISEAVKGASAVLHLAGQVAVTTSVKRPQEDFDINLQGTLNVLEAVRLRNPEAPLLFASTNKVYGNLEGVGFSKDERLRRYHPLMRSYLDDASLGIDERQPLDLYSPYGCSKGAADQYVHDYARIYGLCTAVLRMSCIYGTRQFGTEDQGWVAHFLLRVMRGEPVTLYGDGYQVRDILYIDDAVSAWFAVLEQIEKVRGCVFNLGGGPRNTVSLLQMLDLLAELCRKKPEVAFGEVRAGDQPWYVSDIRALSRATGWTPQVGVRAGLEFLHVWLESRFAPAQRQALAQ